VPELEPVDEPDELAGAALLQSASSFETGHSDNPPRPALASADDDEAAALESSEERIFLSAASVGPALSNASKAAPTISFFIASSIVGGTIPRRKNRGNFVKFQKSGDDNRRKVHKEIPSLLSPLRGPVTGSLSCIRQ